MKSTLGYQIDEEDDAGEGEDDAQEELRRRRRHEPAQLVLCRLRRVKRKHSFGIPSFQLCEFHPYLSKIRFFEVLFLLILNLKLGTHSSATKIQALVKPF